jgi:hypothetical protein
MCDYSLHAVKNRLAVEGEQLIINKFHTGSKGLASVADMKSIQPRNLIELVRDKLRPERFWDRKKKIPAICIPPGAKLELSGIPKSAQKLFGIGEAEEVTFAQLTDEPFRYRDAFRFKNGEEILIQKFPDGVRAEVLSLELEERPAAAAEKSAGLAQDSRQTARP